MAHRTKTPYDYDSRPTFGGFRRPLCLLGVCGLVNRLHPPFGCFPYTPLLWRGAVRPLCLLGVCGLVNRLHPPFGCFPYTPLLWRGAVLTRQEHNLTILLGNSFGERGARTTNSIVFRGLRSSPAYLAF